jgi:hypothetical protein
MGDQETYVVTRLIRELHRGRLSGDKVNVTAVLATDAGATEGAAAETARLL